MSDEETETMSEPGLNGDYAPCAECAKGEHGDCLDPSPMNPSPSELALLDAIFGGGPYVMCCCETAARRPMGDSRGPTMRLSALVVRFKPGSREEWSWAQEAADLWSREPAVMAALMTDIQTNGIREPIVLGDDGRVWDGHHRIVIAVRLGIKRVPVEFVGAGSDGREASALSDGALADRTTSACSPAPTSRSEGVWMGGGLEIICGEANGG